MSVPKGMKVLSVHVDKELHSFLKLLSVRKEKAIAVLIREFIEEIRDRESERLRKEASEQPEMF